MSTTNQPTVARYAADTTATDRAWMPRGICSDAPDQDDWQPAIEDPDDPSTQRAIQICQHCPVRAECRDYALNRRWLNGIWGGTTTLERATLRRQRRKTTG